VCVVPWIGEGDAPHRTAPGLGIIKLGMACAGTCVVRARKPWALAFAFPRGFCAVPGLRDRDGRALLFLTAVVCVRSQGFASKHRRFLTRKTIIETTCCLVAWDLDSIHFWACVLVLVAPT
jgi:hypothetical protein